MIQQFDCFCNDNCAEVANKQGPRLQFHFMTARGFPSGGSSCHHSRLRLRLRLLEAAVGAVGWWWW